MSANMLTGFKYGMTTKKILSKTSVIDCSSFSQNPRRLHRSRNPCNRVRSAAKHEAVGPRRRTVLDFCKDRRPKNALQWHGDGGGVGRECVAHETNERHPANDCATPAGNWIHDLMTIIPSTLRLDTRSMLRRVEVVGLTFRVHHKLWRFCNRYGTTNRHSYNVTIFIRNRHK